MSMPISQIGVYRMLNGHNDGYASSRAATSSRTGDQDEKQRQSGLNAGAPDSMARNHDSDFSLSNARLADNPVNDSARVADSDVSQLNGGSIDMAKFFQDLDSGAVTAPNSTHVQGAEEKYLRVKGVI